jgi:hypothetical protein
MGNTSAVEPVGDRSHRHLVGLGWDTWRLDGEVGLGKAELLGSGIVGISEASSGPTR